MKLYVTCETDFLKGIEIFEAIIEKIYLDTSISRISQLDRTIHEMAAPGEVEEAPEEPAAADEQPEEPAPPPPITGEVREREEDVAEESISDRRRNAARMDRRAREAAVRAYSQHPVQHRPPANLPADRTFVPPQGNPLAPSRFTFGSSAEVSDAPFQMGKAPRRSVRFKAGIKPQASAAATTAATTTAATTTAAATQDIQNSASSDGAEPESPDPQFIFTAPTPIATTAESDTSPKAAVSNSPRFTFTNPR